MATTTKKITVSIEEFKNEFLTSEAMPHVKNSIDKAINKMNTFKKLGFVCECEVNNCQLDWYENLEMFIFFENRKFSVNPTNDTYEPYLATWKFKTMSQSEKNDAIKKAGLICPNGVKVPTYKKVLAHLIYEAQKFDLLESRDKEKNKKAKEQLTELKQINDKVNIDDLTPRLIYTESKYFDLKTNVCEGFLSHEIRIKYVDENKIDVFKKLMNIK